MIERLNAKVNMGTTNDRFLLVPDFFNDSLGSEFTAFLDHVEGVSEKLKQLFLENGYDVVAGIHLCVQTTVFCTAFKSKPSKKFCLSGCMRLCGNPSKQL